MSNIEWTNETWNPVVGCSKCSPACDNCYAERMAVRLASNPATPHYNGVVADGHWNGDTVLVESALEKPLRWRKPRLIFVGSMTDLFHGSVPDEWLDMVFAVMAMCPQHTFQVLTKRPERMREYLTSARLVRRWFNAGRALLLKYGRTHRERFDWDDRAWPILRDEKTILSNVWIGTTIWDQQSADRTVPILLESPAAVRFVSVEPMLGAVDLSSYLDVVDCQEAGNLDHLYDRDGYGTWISGLDWVICGGETGPGARMMHPDWARSLRDQCVEAGVPFFFKQWGEFLPRDVTGQMDFNGEYVKSGKDSFSKKYKRLLDGQEWGQMPEVQHGR